MTKALITGASGFIGGHLAEHLVQRGDEVRCLVRRPQSCHLLRQTGAQLFQGDVTQPASLHDAIAGVDVVYHLAALTSALRDADMTSVNHGGAMNVAHACAAQKKPPIHVFVSSVAAAGPVARDQVRTEADVETPISRYGRSKRLGELAVAEFAHLVPTTIVRPGIVFGERNRDMLPIFSAIERFRVHAQAGFLSPKLSMIYVKDLVEILVRAAEQGVRISPQPSESNYGQGIYFACAPEFPTYGELGRMIARVLGHSRVFIWRMGGPLPWLAAALNEMIGRLRGTSDTFNLDKIREARAASWACSPAAVERDLRFKPTQSLEEQLAITAQWYRDNRWIGERPVLAALKNAVRLLYPESPISRPFGPHHQAESSNR